MAKKKATHRTLTSKKLYVVRDSTTQLTGSLAIQQMHGTDLRQTSRAEAAKRSQGRTVSKKSVKKGLTGR
jgi:hypothetical protein